MRIEQLIGINIVKNSALEKDEFRLPSIYSELQLPKNGITLAKNMAAYEATCTLVQKTKIPTNSNIQIFSVEYIGERVTQNSSARISLQDVKQSNYVRLNELSSDVYQPIHEVVWKWVEENQVTNPDFKSELLAKGFYKQTLEGIKPKLTSTRLIIANYPELISLIHDLPDFNHLDAIAYQIRINEQMEEFITIFKDNSLMLDDVAKTQRHIRASMSNFKGYLVLPASVKKSKKLKTKSQILEEEKQMEQESIVNVA